MKIFQSICIIFEPLGISALRTLQSTRINPKNVVVFLLLLNFAVFSTAFLLFKAETLAEFIYSFYTSVTTVGFTLIFSILVWKMSYIFKVIDDFGNFIEKRKLTLIDPFAIRFLYDINCSISEFKFEYINLTF